jgi:hypothetical protein
LALQKNLQLDERRQRALTRYYLDAGAGGVAIAVHTTQFEIRDPGVGLLKPVLELGREEVTAFSAKTGKAVVTVAGIVGQTGQAVQEAEQAADLGYDVGLLSLAALRDASNADLLRHCRSVAQVMPLMGFYLQPAVGGRLLDKKFWQEFSQIENVVAIKVAPFNRYQTLDVLHGVAESGCSDRIALYTGNDDTIVADLLTGYRVTVKDGPRQLQFVGGLLGHWAVWTSKAVECLQKIRKVKERGTAIPADLLTIGAEITDCNAAFFDTANNFAGCIVGLHEVLRRQGLLQGCWTLDGQTGPGELQKAEIDRVYRAYPHLNDDDFIRENLQRWLL